MTSNLREFLNRGSVQGAMMAGAMVIAGALDGLVSIAAGRLLVKEQFAVFVAVMALLQILVNVTNVIRNVVAYYTADLRLKLAVYCVPMPFFNEAGHGPGVGVQLPRA